MCLGAERGLQGEEVFDGESRERKEAAVGQEKLLSEIRGIN